MQSRWSAVAGRQDPGNAGRPHRHDRPPDFHGYLPCKHGYVPSRHSCVSCSNSYPPSRHSYVRWNHNHVCSGYSCGCADTVVSAADTVVIPPATVMFAADTAVNPASTAMSARETVVVRADTVGNARARLCFHETQLCFLAGRASLGAAHASSDGSTASAAHRQLGHGTARVCPPRHPYQIGSMVSIRPRPVSRTSAFG